MLKITTLGKRNSRNLKRFLFLMLLFPTLGILVSFYSERDLGLKKRMPLMDHKMEATDGKHLSLGDLTQENGLIVIFSCNTCPFVVGSKDFPGWEIQYNDLYRSASEAKIGFALINSNEAKRDNEDSMEAMKKHASGNNYSMPYLLDKNSELADAFGAKTTPHVYVFNGQDKLIYKGSIDNSYDNQRTSEQYYLMDVIQSISNDTKIKINDTPPRGCSIKRVKTN